MIILGPVAVSDNNVIGQGNDLPWHLPEDLKHFKELTLGKTVLMGRKTYESIFNRLGKPLPGRKSVVITRQIDYKTPEGVLVFNSVDQALKHLTGDVYIIGGAEIFRQTLPLAEKMFITHVKGDYEGDAFFPQIGWSTWKKTEEENFDNYSFVTYTK